MGAGESKIKSSRLLSKHLPNQTIYPSHRHTFNACVCVTVCLCVLRLSPGPLQIHTIAHSARLLLGDHSVLLLLWVWSFLQTSTEQQRMGRTQTLLPSHPQPPGEVSCLDFEASLQAQVTHMPQLLALLRRLWNLKEVEPEQRK